MMASSEQSTMAARRDWRASGAPLVASLSEGRVGWRVADYTWATETVTRTWCRRTSTLVHPRWAARGWPAGTRASAAQPALQLGLAHPRVAAHASAPCLVAQLGDGAAARAAVRAQPAATAGGDVLDRGPARGPRLARARPLLVGGACGDLRRGVLLAAALEEALLDVLVLPFALRAPALLWHRRSPSPQSFGSPVTLPPTSFTLPAMRFSSPMALSPLLSTLVVVVV